MEIPEETRHAIKKAVSAVAGRASDHGRAQRELGERGAVPVTIAEYEASLPEWQAVMARAAAAESRLKVSIAILENLLADAGVIE